MYHNLQINFQHKYNQIKKPLAYDYTENPLLSQVKWLYQHYNQIQKLNKIDRRTLLRILQSYAIVICAVANRIKYNTCDDSYIMKKKINAKHDKIIDYRNPIIKLFGESTYNNLKNKTVNDILKDKPKCKQNLYHKFLGEYLKINNGAYNEVLS